MDVLRRSVFVECTVSKDKKLVEEELIGNFGSDCYSSVVLTQGGFFVTFVEEECVDTIVDLGMILEGEECTVRKVGSREILITFLEVPEFVEDATIQEKLLSLKCELKSTVIWDRPGGKYYGKRSLKIVLPEGISSLPYSLRLKDALGHEDTYAVRHDRQLKVCNKCFSTTHLYKDCPDFLCRGCGQQGHIARYCPNKQSKADFRRQNGAAGEGGPADGTRSQPPSDHTLSPSDFPTLPPPTSVDERSRSAIIGDAHPTELTRSDRPVSASGQPEKRPASSGESGSGPRPYPPRVTRLTHQLKKSKSDSSATIANVTAMDVDSRRPAQPVNPKE